MDNVTKKNIIDLLKKALVAVKKSDIKELKELSNYTLHSASINQDDDSIGIAVLIYSLYKVYSRTDYVKTKSWYFFDKTTLLSLRGACDRLKHDDIDGYREIIKDYFKSVDKLDSKLRRYVREIIDKAKIKKGSRLYEHGISAGRVAEILGITNFELMDYVGETGVADVVVGRKVMERINKARGLFK